METLGKIRYVLCSMFYVAKASQMCSLLNEKISLPENPFEIQTGMA